MKRLVTILVACVVVALAGFALLVFSVSDERVRVSAAARLAELTGFSAEIRGLTDVSVFPVPRFEIGNVVFTEPGRADAEAVASIDILKGRVALLPLLLGRFEVGGFTLIRPRLNLVVDRQGRANWTPVRHGSVGSVLGAPPGTPAANTSSAGAVRLGDLRIEDGAIVFVDQNAGIREEVSAINAEAAWPDLLSGLTVRSSMVWHGEIVTVSIDADTPYSFLQSGSATLRLDIESVVANAAFTGEARYTADPQLEGEIAMSAPSLRGLARWIGRDPGLGAGLNALEIDGKLSLLPHTVTVSDLSLTLDGNTAEGGFKLSETEEGVDLQATLAFDALDLSVYGGPEAAASPAEIDRTKAFALPVDLAGLKTVALDIRLSAASVRYRDFALQETAGTVTLRGGTLDVGIGEAALYGGMAQGALSAKPVAEGTRAKISMTIDGSDIGPILTALAGATPVRGASRARVSLAGRGETIADIVGSLAGEATLAIEQGAVTGLDVAQVAEMLNSGRVEGWPTADTETEFTELTASFTATAGSAATDDFRLTGPNVAVKGDGELHFLSAAIAGHGTAKIRSAEDEASDDADADAVLSIPFVIEGPVSRPSLYPDPVWLTKNPGANPEDIARTREEIRQSTPEEIIDDLVRRGADLFPGYPHRNTPETVPQ